MAGVLDERRRYPRFELILDARYKVINYEEAFRKGKTRNFSAEGLCLESDERLRVNVYLQIEIDLEDHLPPVSLIGQVVWSQEDTREGRKNNKFLSGIKLVNIPASDEGRFLKYYCDKIAEKLSRYLNA